MGTLCLLGCVAIISPHLALYSGILFLNGLLLVYEADGTLLLHNLFDLIQVTDDGGSLLGWNFVHVGYLKHR